MIYNLCHQPDTKFRIYNKCRGDIVVLTYAEEARAIDVPCLFSQKYVRYSLSMCVP
jgi:hypothetical protein